jgi:hypothetical protein
MLPCPRDEALHGGHSTKTKHIPKSNIAAQSLSITDMVWRVVLAFLKPEL